VESRHRRPPERVCGIRRGVARTTMVCNRSLGRVACTLHKNGDALVPSDLLNPSATRAPYLRATATSATRKACSENLAAAGHRVAADAGLALAEKAYWSGETLAENTHLGDTALADVTWSHQPASVQPAESNSSQSLAASAIPSDASSISWEIRTFACLLKDQSLPLGRDFAVVR
jgi:hypothetical protein